MIKLLHGEEFDGHTQTSRERFAFRGVANICKRGFKFLSEHPDGAVHRQRGVIGYTFRLVCIASITCFSN